MRNSKIKNLDELERLVQVFKSESKKIIHCHGVFDLLHPGHVLHLKAARQFGDVLIVTVTPTDMSTRGQADQCLMNSSVWRLLQL